MSINIYKYLRLATSNRIPGWVKLIGLAALLPTRRRMIGVFLDPVVACNLRCRMCYFSDDDHRRSIVGRPMSDAELAATARAFYHRALKLQIGCGAEPTLYPRLAEIIAQGRKAGVPFIAVTTNGQFFGSGKMDFEALCAAGLDEVTLSMHGTHRDTYETLMPGADYDTFRRALDIMIAARHKYPGLKIRVNFTVNSLNIHDLKDDSFWNLWHGESPDVIQLRPVQDLGDSSWKDFDMTPLIENYDLTFLRIADEARLRGATCVIPTREQITEVASAQSHASAVIEDVTYCYVATGSFYKPDFDIANDTFESYHRRNHTAARILRCIFSRRTRKHHTSKKLNYNVK